MRKHTLLFITAFLMTTCVAWYASAQDESDALRFSNLSSQGTARSIGIGGALGSIGGDFSSLSVNPAGIGVYRTSEFTLTPSLKLNGTQSSYTGTDGTTTITSDNNTRFTLNNFGAVFTNAATGTRYKRSKWKAVSFGIGFNRVADFNSNYRYNGYNDSSSASEVFLIDAINFPDDINNTTTFAGLGYQTYLINQDSNGFYKAPNYQTGLNQSRSVEERGGITDINFSFGGNYEEKLFLGATVAIPSIRYDREVTLREDDATTNGDNDFASFDYNESLSTRGTGINLKVGAIYSFNKYFRAGASLHSPTYFSMTDEQTMVLNANTENLKSRLGDFSGSTARAEGSSQYQYSLVTPWKGVISAAGIIGKNGFITVDYEYVDYGSARLNFDNADSRYQDEVNNGIKSMYKGASNIRIGGEAKFDLFMLRLGFGYYGNPYKNTNQGSETMRYSAGVGFRFDNVFLDLGFSHTATERKEQPYTLNYSDPRIGYIGVPSANIKSSLNNVAVTVGFKFK